MTQYLLETKEGNRKPITDTEYSILLMEKKVYHIIRLDKLEIVKYWN